MCFIDRVHHHSPLLSPSSHCSSCSLLSACSSCFCGGLAFARSWSGCFLLHSGTVGEGTDNSAVAGGLDEGSMPLEELARLDAEGHPTVDKLGEEVLLLGRKRVDGSLNLRVTHAAQNARNHSAKPVPDFSISRVCGGGVHRSCQRRSMVSTTHTTNVSRGREIFACRTISGVLRFETKEDVVDQEGEITCIPRVCTVRGEEE